MCAPVAPPSVIKYIYSWFQSSFTRVNSSFLIISGDKETLVGLLSKANEK